MLWSALCYNHGSGFSELVSVFTAPRCEAMGCFSMLFGLHELIVHISSQFLFRHQLVAWSHLQWEYYTTEIGKFLKQSTPGIRTPIPAVSLQLLPVWLSHHLQLGWQFCSCGWAASYTCNHHQPSSKSTSWDDVILLSFVFHFQYWGGLVPVLSFLINS